MIYSNPIGIWLIAFLFYYSCLALSFSQENLNRFFCLSESDGEETSDNIKFNFSLSNGDWAIR